MEEHGEQQTKSPVKIDWTSRDLRRGYKEAESGTPNFAAAAVADLANSIFGDPQIAEEWLREPNLATDREPPISLLGTTEGVMRVRTLLQRIEYGVLA